MFKKILEENVLSSEGFGGGVWDQPYMLLLHIYYSTFKVNFSPNGCKAYKYMKVVHSSRHRQRLPAVA